MGIEGLIITMGLAIIGCVIACTIPFGLFLISRINTLLEKLTVRLVEFITSLSPQQTINRLSHYGSLIKNQKKYQKRFNKHKEELADKIQKFEAFLESEEEKSNPLSSEEIKEVRKYINKIQHGELLSPQEFDRLSDLTAKIQNDLPPEKKSEFNWLLAGLLGFVLGLILASILSEK